MPLVGFYRRVVFALALTVWTSVAQSQPDAWQEQRSLFVAAEIAFETGDLARFNSLRSQLQNYPLRPYLDYLLLESRIAHDASAIESALASLADSPLGAKLRAQWLKHLAQRQQWTRYLSAYRPTGSTALTCSYLHALIATGRGAEAIPQIAPLWQVGHSQPDACNPVFEYWRSSNQMTRTQVWRRIAASIQTGNLGMVRYLKGYLGPQQSAMADLWIEVRDDPLIVENLERFPSVATAQEILVWGLLKLAARDPHLAAQVWDRLRVRREFSTWESGVITRRIGLSFAREHFAQGYEWLSNLAAEFVTDETTEWLLLSALRLQRWDALETRLRALPSEDLLDLRWQYWLARALEAEGKNEEARELYEKLSTTRSYYGFLSADKLDRPYQFNHISVTLEPNAIETVSKNDAIERAHELYRLQRWTDAGREWQFAISQFDPSQISAAAKLAEQWGWHSRAIITIALTKQFDDLELRFPLAHRELFLEQATRRGIEPGWAFAVARQESAFMPDVKSSAGALGVMQIMPATGRYIANKLEVPGFKSNQLLSAGENISFGTWYLADLLGQLDGNVVLATAAYNAGTHRVERWLPRAEPLAADIWIETIPFGETRGYVRRVLEYLCVYDMRLGRTPTRLKQLLREVPVKLN